MKRPFPERGRISGEGATTLVRGWATHRIDLREKPHLYWSGGKRLVDLSDPAEEAWWITTVLREGRTEDIRALPLDRVRELLPRLPLPRHIKEMWDTYFREVEERAP